MKRKKNQTRRRVRPHLLILLWIWAVCIFMVLDLFLNVNELDEIRPRAEIYRSMRFVAHRMVGEPYLENDRFGEAYSDRARRRSARPTPPSPPLLPVPERAPPRIRAVGGVPLDAESEAGQRLLTRLRAVASQSEDPKKRAAALRAIERLLRARAGDARRETAPQER